MNTKDKLEHIEIKIKQLGFKLERLAKENSLLREENQNLKSALDRVGRQPGDSKDLPEEKDYRIAERQELKAQINQYIQEIDKCIEWLHNN